jgi:glycosyltransferase involved in cell wall biosynthesis
MKDNFSLSVIITYYNKSALEIRSAINSILSQKKINFKIEILIIDDFSHKKLTTKKIKLIKFDKKIYSIKIIRNIKNLGESRARNVGIQKAKNKYIAFLDADDFWTSEKLYTQTEFIKNYNIKCIGCNWNNRKHLISYFNFNREYYILNKFWIAIQWWPHLSTLMCSKNLLNKIRYKKIDYRHGGDGELIMRLSSNSKIYIINKNMVTCHFFKKSQYSSGLSSNLQSMRKAEYEILSNNFNFILGKVLISLTFIKYIIRKFIHAIH